METSLRFTGREQATYRFLGKLGAGGMAEVFVAVTEGTAGFHKLLVLKLLRENLPESQDSLAMFMDEARLAARLNHRNIVQTYEVGQVAGRYAIVMEFLEGASLARLRRLAHGHHADHRLPLPEALYIVSEALGGLHYAHELCDYDGSPLCFVHRDFSPANLMVTLDGQVKVLDFGVAKTRASLAHTRDGVIKGTARYMARESVLGLAADRRTDVYMAGVVLWQLVTGQVPWADHEDMAVLFAVAKHRLAPIRSIDPCLPEGLEQIITRATEPDRDLRFASAGELRDALVTFARESGLGSDPDRVASLVRELAGRECQDMRRRIDAQLSQATTSPDPSLALLRTTSAGWPESSSSRVRPTADGGRLHGAKVRARSLVLAAGLALSGLLASLGASWQRGAPADAVRAAPLTAPVPEVNVAMPEPRVTRVAEAQPAAESDARANDGEPYGVPAVTEVARAPVRATARPADMTGNVSGAGRRESALRPREPLRPLPVPPEPVPAAAEPSRPARMIDKENPWAQ